jgi:hypothetical protein
LEFQTPAARAETRLCVSAQDKAAFKASDLGSEARPSIVISRVIDRPAAISRIVRQHVRADSIKPDSTECARTRIHSERTIQMKWSQSLKTANWVVYQRSEFKLTGPDISHDSATQEKQMTRDRKREIDALWTQIRHQSDIAFGALEGQFSSS